MGGEATELVGASFRFRRASSTYLAVRLEKHWRVTLEGNNSAWMFWVLSDQDIAESCWGSRLTD